LESGQRARRGVDRRCFALGTPAGPTGGTIGGPFNRRSLRGRGGRQSNSTVVRGAPPLAGRPVSTTCLGANAPKRRPSCGGVGGNLRAGYKGQSDAPGGRDGTKGVIGGGYRRSIQASGVLRKVVGRRRTAGRDLPGGTSTHTRGAAQGTRAPVGGGSVWQGVGRNVAGPGSAARGEHGPAGGNTRPGHSIYGYKWAQMGAGPTRFSTGDQAAAQSTKSARLARREGRGSHGPTVL